MNDNMPAIEFQPRSPYLFRSESSRDNNRIFAIAGGKGGIGKTVLTAAMGITLASRGESAVLVDADFSGPNLHNCLGIQNPPVTIKDFFDRKEPNINNLLLDTPISGLRLLAGSEGTLGIANYKHWEKQKFIRHINEIDSTYILLDLGAGSSFNTIDLFLCADVGIIVGTPEPPAVQQGYNFIKVCFFRLFHILFRNIPELSEIFPTNPYHIQIPDSLSLESIVEQIASVDTCYIPYIQKILEYFKPKLVMNMVESQADSEEGFAIQIAAKDILDVDVDYIGYIPFDNGIRKAVKSMRPDWLMVENMSTTKYIQKVVDVGLLGETVPTPSFCNSRVHLDRKLSKEQFERDVICSIKCYEWGKCRVQSGGYPCRIKYVGYFSQSKRSA